MIISAIICTHNRSDYLSRSINSLVHQSYPASDYEILVIDNHSSDDTKKIVTHGFQHVKNLRYIYEGAIGLSHARNTGWKEANGKYVAYLDDDAIVEKDWLEKIVSAFETIKPMPGCVGGKTEPIFETPRPRWLTNTLLPYLSIINWSNTPIILSCGQWLIGTNMAFPKKLLADMNGFPLNLGRIGNKLLSGEERLLQLHLQAQGMTSYYDPRISVSHHIPISRLTRSWFVSRSFWSGVSKSVIIENLSVCSKIPIKNLKGSSLIKPFRQRLGALKELLSPFTVLCYLASLMGRISAQLKIVK